MYAGGGKLIDVLGTRRGFAAVMVWWSLASAFVFMVTLVLVGIVLLVINYVVQHGLTRVTANRAIVIYLFELVVAALSAWLLAGETVGLKEYAGGAMIIAASATARRGTIAVM